MKVVPAFLTLMLCVVLAALSQSLYTARGYWEESNKAAYRSIKDKQQKNETLTADEQAYMADFEAYLSSYFARLSAEEKQRYVQMKEQWDRELDPTLKAPRASQQTQAEQQQIEQSEFEWRGRDRAKNALWGIYYGASLAYIAGMEDAAAVGIPFITGGIWMLGPAMNPKKYEGITQTTVNASNNGKFLGAIYGWSLAFAVAGESESVEKIGLGLSTVASIGLGEWAFQTQKKKNISAGRVELLRHYGVLGPLVGGAVLAATETESANLVGVGLLAGAGAGLAIGNKAAKAYDYTQGDVDAISSLSIITTGLGVAVISDAIANSSNPSNALVLVPAATAVAGTLLGQRQVRNVHLTKRQGSTISLSSVGGALVGVGVLALAEADSPVAWFGVPSALALIMHQSVFAKYRRDNLTTGLGGIQREGKKVAMSMKLMPENYFVSKNMSPQKLINNPSLAAASPLVNISFKFK